MSNRPNFTPALFQKYKESCQRRLVGDRNISGSHLKIGIMGTWFMNSSTAEAWPGEMLISKTTGASERTINRGIKYLERKGHYAVERTPGKVNRYYPQPEDGFWLNDTTVK